MDSDQIDQMLQACRDEISRGNGCAEAERLINYIADHPDEAPTMRRRGQSARAGGNPALAAVLFRAALAGALAKRKLAASRKASADADSRTIGSGESESFDASAVDYIEQQSHDIERSRAQFELAEPPTRQPARSVVERASSSPIRAPARPTKSAPQTVILEDDGDYEEQPHQTTIFEALTEGAHLVDPIEDDESESDDYPDLVAAWDSESADQQHQRLQPAVEVDWETLASESYEFDEAPTRDELVQLKVEGPISRHQRAQQEAIRLGLEYGWDEPGVQLLTEIFETYSWSSTKRSLRTALDAGSSRPEIQLAHETRLLWRDSPHLALNLSGYGYEHTYLSWPLALQIVKVFAQLPDISEIQALLDAAYDDWRSASHLQQAYSAFRDYLKARLSSSFSSSLCSPAVEFESSVGIDYYEADPITDGAGGSPYRRDLEDYGLLAKHHGDLFLNRVGIIEWHPDVRSWVERQHGD